MTKRRNCPDNPAVECNYIAIVYDKFLDLTEGRETGSKGNSKKALTLAAHIIANRLIQTEKGKADLLAATTFRDIGKLGIPEELLNNREKLNSSDSRWETIKNHPRISIEILQAAGTFFSPAVFEIIKHHHPWYESDGFLVNDDWSELTISYQIVSIIDAYIGLRSERTWRNGTYDHIQAIEEMLNHDRRFCPSLLKYLSPILSKLNG
jgi:response regulator RpfG family c-di-GMP phosphodiesterase